MKIRQSDLDKIINEEVERFFKIRNLKKQLNEVSEELKHMEESEELEEVKAGPETHVKSHAWTGEEDGDVKFKPEFQKKGSHLLEDEESDATEIEVGAESEPMDLGGEFEKMFAQIGKMIDSKLGGGSTEEVPSVGGEMGLGDPEGDEGDDFDDIELDLDSDDDEETSDITDEELDEIDAQMSKEDVTKEYNETIGNEEETHHSDAATMAKESINESVNTRRFKILSEGMESEAKLSNELDRMRKLAKI